jgi:hypothetical protein
MDLRAPILARLFANVKSSLPERPTYLAENVNILLGPGTPRTSGRLGTDPAVRIAGVIAKRGPRKTKISPLPTKISAGAFFCDDKNPVI